MAGDLHPIRPERRTVTLSAGEFDVIRRGMLDRLHEGLERTLSLVDEMRIKADVDAGATASDTRASIGILREELAALEALGWHDEHYAQERREG